MIRDGFIHNNEYRYPRALANYMNLPNYIPDLLDRTWSLSIEMAAEAGTPTLHFNRVHTNRKALTVYYDFHMFLSRLGFDEQGNKAVYQTVFNQGY